MNFRIKTLLSAVLCVVLCALCVFSCSREAPHTPAPSESAAPAPAAEGSAADPAGEGSPANEAGGTDEAVNPEEPSEVLPEREPLPPLGSVVDADADSVEGIAIRSAEELRKIGKDPAYPLDADYVLAADIDLTNTMFDTIGEIKTESGIVTGKGVFSGTFDGRGHMIVGMNIAASSSSRIHVGMFGTVASDDKNDPAVIRNLIIKDATVTGQAKGVACFAILCGQAAGYVDIDNIAIVGGSVEATYAGGDMLGAAALIGECRTGSNTKLTNKPIHISNIFTSASVTGTNNGKSYYTSGIIGRIRASDVGSLKNIVQVGTITHEGAVGGGNAIALGDAGAKASSNVYYLAGCGVDWLGLGAAVSGAELASGTLKLDGDLWHTDEGLYPMPDILYNCPYISALDFITLSLADGESADLVQSDFGLPSEVMGQKVVWTSSNPSFIRIASGEAKVTKPALGSEKVTLTASTADGSKNFTLYVFSGVYGSLKRENNTLIPVNYADGSTYRWSSLNLSTGRTKTSTGATFTLTPNTVTLVTLSVDGSPDVYYFDSNLPTVYITSSTAYYDVSKGGYSRADMSIQTTEKFAATSYNGSIQIKLRGNSTAYASKRPFKIKLDDKADIFGMGANKHWCLLANSYDRTNLRNKVSYDFSMDLGLVGCASEMVNLFYNGEYYGLYEFTEAIRVGETRVDIFDWEEEAEDVAKAIAKKEGLTKQERDVLSDAMERDLSWVTSGVFGEYTLSDYVDTSAWDITGGYLIEDDAYYDEISQFKTTNDMKLMLHKPEYLATNEEMMNYIRTYTQDCEDAIYAPNRLSGEGLHYSEYMDVPSFVDFWVVNTLYKNVELLFKSCYFYKPVGGKITWGPVWDMDWTSANHVNLDPTSSEYDSWKQGQSQDREYWYKALYNDPWFILQLYERWGEIGDKIDAMFAHYDELAAEIKDAAEMDNARWGYSWPYTREINTLREWLVNRRKWMDEQMKDPATLLESLGFYKKSQKLEIASVKEDGDGFEVKLKVTGGASIASADVLLNGKIVLSDIAVSNGATFRIAKSDLRGSGLYNSVEVLAKDGSGKYLAITKRSGLQGSNANEGAWTYLVTP